MVNKKTIREFLKPSWKKILLAMVFLLITLFVEYFGCGADGFGVSCNSYTGLPLPILECYSMHYETQLTNIFSSNCHLVETLPLIIFLLVDFVFWYLISCLIILIYNKIRIRKKITL